jgi:GT2 family glycosyltransferase
MKLSVIIVNYNVQYFLEQCLMSVQKALVGIDAEVFVVDNVSKDDSVQMVASKFPEVVLIANTENVGFSKANNQAMRLAKGEYVLLLNPDTLVEEDTFRKCINWMDSHPQGGGLGVRMVDGSGKFLPESKRGIPYPMTSFYKISGLYRLFPKSPKINHYYLGHLSEMENNEVEILSGAYMFMRKKTLDEVGLLDEDFFMYGEDIDLSWRILKGGYKNYYLADTRIIHYKGESTKKGSLNYVYVFYQAMDIFAKKHFSNANAGGFSLLLQMAIWFRASLSFCKRIVSTLSFPVADLLLTLSLWWIIKDLYSESTGIDIPNRIAIPAFAVTGLFWLVQAWIQGLYDRPLKPNKTWVAIGKAAIYVLLIYSLLPETWRFSRLLIIAGSLIAMLVFWINRKLLLWWKDRGKITAQNVVIVGSDVECARVLTLMQQTESFAHTRMDTVDFIQGVSGQTLSAKVRIEKITEVVFCAKDVSSESIIAAMSQLSHSGIEMKIAPPESYFLIGSQSIDGIGTQVMVDINSISLPENKRKKRLLDIVTSLFVLLFFSMIALMGKWRGDYFKDAFYVLFSKKTWVGYRQKIDGLPVMPEPVVAIYSNELSDDQKLKQSMLYAKDYSVSNDLRVLAKTFFNLTF